MSAGAEKLLGSFDREELDDEAAKLVSVILAVAEFARPTDEDRPGFFEATVVRALVASLAGWIGHPHTDEEDDDAWLATIGALLRDCVAELRSEA